MIMENNIQRLYRERDRKIQWLKELDSKIGQLVKELMNMLYTEYNLVNKDRYNDYIDLLVFYLDSVKNREQELDEINFKIKACFN